MNSKLIWKWEYPKYQIPYKTYILINVVSICSNVQSNLLMFVKERTKEHVSHNFLLLQIVLVLASIPWPVASEYQTVSPVSISQIKWNFLSVKLHNLKFNQFWRNWLQTMIKDTHGSLLVPVLESLVSVQALNIRNKMHLQVVKIMILD